MLSSVPFLIITFIIYGLIKELRTTHGKCVMCYVASLTILYSSMPIVNLFNFELLENHNTLCKIGGYTVLMSIMMCFLWLNVMCYDTFTSIR